MKLLNRINDNALLIYENKMYLCYILLKLLDFLKLKRGYNPLFSL